MCRSIEAEIVLRRAWQQRSSAVLLAPAPTPLLLVPVIDLAMLCHYHKRDLCHYHKNDLCHIQKKDLCQIQKRDLCHIQKRDLCHIQNRDLYHYRKRDYDIKEFSKVLISCAGRPIDQDFNDTQSKPISMFTKTKPAIFQSWCQRLVSLEIFDQNDEET